MANRTSLLVACCFLLSGSQIAGQTPSSGARLRQVTYAVADLVVPIGGLDYPLGAKDADRNTKETWLMNLIQRTVAPESWSGAGGTGTMEYFPLGMSLKVCQTEAVQAEVADLLETMRRVQNIQISLEIRVLETTARVAALVPQLDDARLKTLLEKLTGDRNTNIIAAPKVTTFSGQKVSLQFEGFECHFQGMLGADLRQVRLDLRARMGDVNFEKSTTLPEGTTFAISRKKDDATYLVLLVTPRMLINVETTRPEGKHDDAVVRAAAVEAQPATKPAPLAPEIQKPAARPAPINEKLARILERYEKACARGDKAKARMLAAKALEIDPSCFQKGKQVSDVPYPNERMEELLQTSGHNSRVIQGEWRRWEIDAGSTPVRVHGGVGP